MKKTVQKEVILNAVMANKDHPTADRIYSCLKEDYPKLSLGTVYRNLNLFAETGTIARFMPPNQSVRFDYNTTPHEHIICEVCDEVMDVKENMSFGYIESQTGYKVTGHSLTIYGICPSCMNKKQ